MICNKKATIPLCCERRPYTPSSDVTPRRSLPALLRTGDLAAHTVHRLMLLDPSPDMVHGSALRKTHSSTQDGQLIPKRSTLRRGINPCCSGFQVQGAANSPAGMAYLHSRKRGCCTPYYSILFGGLQGVTQKFKEISQLGRAVPARVAVFLLNPGTPSGAVRGWDGGASAEPLPRSGGYAHG